MVKVSQLGLSRPVKCGVCKRTLSPNEEVFRSIRDGEMTYLCVHWEMDPENQAEFSDDEEHETRAYLGCIKKYAQWVSSRKNYMLLTSPIPEYLKDKKLLNSGTLNQLANEKLF